MEPLSHFDAALERAIAMSASRKRLLALGTLGVGALALAGGLLGALLQFAVMGGVVLLAGVVLLVTSAPSAQLTSLRGAAPEQWVPSPSHGLLAVRGEELVSGRFTSLLDRHATRRVDSVSYDDAAHAIVVQLVDLVQTRDGEREQRRREVVALDGQVPAERAFGFAKQLLTLSQR